MAHLDFSLSRADFELIEKQFDFGHPFSIIRQTIKLLSQLQVASRIKAEPEVGGCIDEVARQWLWDLKDQERGIEYE